MSVHVIIERLIHQEVWFYLFLSYVAPTGLPVSAKVQATQGSRSPARLPLSNILIVAAVIIFKSTNS